MRMGVSARGLGSASTCADLPGLGPPPCIAETRPNLASRSKLEAGVLSAGHGLFPDRSGKFAAVDLAVRRAVDGDVLHRVLEAAARSPPDGADMSGV